MTLRLEGVDGPELEGLIDDDVAVVLVNQVDYRSGAAARRRRADRAQRMRPGRWWSGTSAIRPG